MMSDKDDVLRIYNKDGSVTEVAHPFDALKITIMARAARFMTVRSLVDSGVFTKEDAKEILSGPLTPGDDSTIYDDSELIDLDAEEAVKAIQLGRDD